jgi:hypothetical protein
MTGEVNEMSAASRGSVANEQAEVLAKGIADIIRIAAEPDWIPVSERLPEEGQEVLAWNGGGQCLKPWQGHVLCEYRNGEWRESQESDLYPSITYWMPLPAPPSEDK